MQKKGMLSSREVVSKDWKAACLMAVALDVGIGEMNACPVSYSLKDCEYIGPLG
jgi:hypothetical protein